MKRMWNIICLSLVILAVAACGGKETEPAPAAQPAATDVTRAEMAKAVLLSLHGEGYLPPSDVGALAFSDIESHPLQAWIEALAAEGLLSGYPDGTFRPNDPVTRAEAAVLMLRVRYDAYYIPPPPTGGSFIDVAGHWAEPWIEELKDQGLLPEPVGDVFWPESRLTSTEMYQLLDLATR